MDRLFTFIIFVSFLSYCEPWFFDGIVDHGNVERCPQRIPRDNYLFALNDTCIELIHDEHSWYDSRRYCTQHHGDLVMIQDMAKQQFIMKALQTAGWDRKGIWIGGTDREKEGHWKWVNGQKMTWGNWKRGQGPGNSGFLFSSGQWEDCAVIRKDDGYKWHDYACNLPQYHYGNFISTTPKSTTMMPKTTSISVGTFQSTTVTTSRSTTILSTTTPTKTTAISTKQKPTTTPRTTPATTIHPSSTPTLTTWPRKTTDSTTTHVSSTMSTTMPSITTPASTTLISTTTLPTTQTSTTHVPTTQTSTTALSATQISTTPAPTTQTSTTKLSTTQTSTTTQSTKTPAQITNLVTTSSTSLKTTTPVPSIYVSSTLTTKVSSTKLTTTQSPVSASTTQETSPSAKSIQTMLTMKAKSTLSPTHMPTMRPTRGALTTIQGIGEKTARPNIPLTTQLVNNQGGLLRRSDTGQKSTHKSSTGYIIGGVCVAIVVAGIIVAVFVVRRRRISLNDTNGKVHGAENPMYSVMYDDTSIPPSIPRDNNVFAYNDTCIELIHDEQSWYDARRNCTQHHGDLVMIQHMAKQQFIMKALQTVGWDRKCIWIGGTDRDQEGHWKWVNGQEMTWGNWERGQGPGNSGFLFSSGQWEDCAVIRKDDGYKWHDYACNLPQYHCSSICEYSKHNLFKRMYLSL
ncbi:unnamed protein product [Mytilus coruscus]|uniref:C-type lectin domain-containing protein n=1 Tax=Mytilus coruscus TaxID=42192 RepID=A0A6J8DJ10_MYTCO|nr:unnamed protein product [Mytilus coruscus]